MRQGSGDDGKGKQRKRNYLFLNISEISFHFRYVRLIYWDALSSGLTAVRGFQLKKNRYQDYKLPCIRTQVELSSTFVCNYEVSSGGGSARNWHLPQGGANYHDVHAYEPICTPKSKI